MSGEVVVVSLISLSTVSAEVVVVPLIGLSTVAGAVVVASLIGLSTVFGAVPVISLMSLSTMSGAVVVVSLIGLVVDTERLCLTLLLPRSESTGRRLEDLDERAFGSEGVAFAAAMVFTVLRDPQRDVSFVLVAPEVPQPSAFPLGSYSAFKSTAAMLAEAIFSEGEKYLASSASIKSSSSGGSCGGDDMVFSVHVGAFSSRLASKQDPHGD